MPRSIHLRASQQELVHMRANQLDTPAFLHVAGEILLLFSPALPAYLWLWPNVSGTEWFVPVQVVVYFYLLGGTLLIGLRRWNLGQLGLNRQGLVLGVICGISIVIGRELAYFATDLPVEFHPFAISRLAGEVAFYFGLVGFIEELLFRGLIYRTLEEWRGTRLAIWGSAIAFGLYHIAWQGPLGFVGTALIGLILGVIRWRTGGIPSLILTHGLIDLLAVEFQPPIEALEIDKVRVDQPFLILLSYVFLLGPVIYLWKFHRSSVEGYTQNGHES
jgi:membrane protease YdiL (CAAX protease family)